MGETRWYHMVAILPSWLLTRAMIPHLPEYHPWHGRPFTLRDWAEHATRMSYDFGMSMWLAAVVMAFGLGMILAGP